MEKDEEQGEEDPKDDLINDVHDIDNDLIEKHIDDQKKLSDTISSARNHNHNHYNVVDTLKSCVHVHQGETAGDYISASPYCLTAEGQSDS